VSDFRPDIWRLQANFDTTGLTAALQHEDAGVRRRAAAALRTLGATEAIPALKAVLDREQDPETRSNIVATLAALELERDRSENESKPDPAQQSEFEQQLEALGSTNTETVIAAANTLGEMQDKRAVEPLVMQFNNLKLPVHVRLVIAEALLKLESAPVEVALLGALRSSKWKVRRNGAAILGQLRADWAVVPLAKALEDENDTVRKTARAALRHINTTEARAALGITDPKNPHKSETLSRARAKAESPNVVLPDKPAESTQDTVNAASEPATPIDPSQPSQPPAPSAEATASPTPASATPQPAPLGSDHPTQRQRAATTPATSAEKLTWPKREQSVEEDQSKIPTRPLDPKRLEEAEERLNRIKPSDA
jgi:HEAT repeat protein